MKTKIGNESESDFWNALAMYLVDAAHSVFRALVALCFDCLMERRLMRSNRWNFALLVRYFATMLCEDND